MPDDSKIDTVRNVYDAWSEARFDDLLGACSEDLVWVVPGRNQFTGRQVGKPAATGVLNKMKDAGYSVSPRHFLSDDVRVVVLAQATTQGEQHGIVDIWTFTGDQVSRYQHSSVDTTLLDSALGTSA